MNHVSKYLQTRSRIDTHEKIERWLAHLLGNEPAQGMRASFHLRRVVLDHEMRHVGVARDQGYTWWQVAVQLMVSPQAAHARWARFVGRLQRRQIKGRR